MSPRLGADGAPPALPVGLLLLGALALLAGCVALSFNARLLLGHHSTAGLVALVHVFTLGFVGLIFAGTLQQLPAVMFVTRLAWPRLGYLTSLLLVVGTAATVWGFVTGFQPALLATGASAVTLGWLLLFAQLLATAMRRWPRDAASQALIASALFLTMTVTAGLLLAGVRSDPVAFAAAGYPQRLHLSLGLFGAFLLGIIGSGQKLLAMFALSKGTVEWRVRLATILIAAGMTAEVFRAFSAVNPGQLPTVLLAGASLLQLWEVAAIHRRRLRRKLEAPVFRYVLAHVFLPVAGLLLIADQPVAAVAAFLVGFIGLAVSGMLVKITSFLVWTAVFAGSRTGGVSGGAPLLRDLLVDGLEPLTTWSFTAGALALCATLVSSWAPLAHLSANLLLLAAASQALQVSHVVTVTVRAGRRLAALAEAA